MNRLDQQALCNSKQNLKRLRCRTEHIDFRILISVTAFFPLCYIIVVQRRIQNHVKHDSR